ncbi:ABC transporter permease [Chelatococcus asaccharovorans]|uniref:Peptide/nickel transport system permease protein n=1 Tax=Chelatococcus asaccharovorans TaxID=28210 RepID=A0A2V3U8X7_9HYPH|nr:ABC transporter permease [Chelatococcus asaccharovorans]MBS7705447.1 ABC transporter permease [Chelatococcus asaccharovorans]PXW60149.1 peptide/nickel transport system permease protein [Chelatococcus asaccharovorans]
MSESHRRPFSLLPGKLLSGKSAEPSPGRLFWMDFFASPVATLSLVVLIVIVLAAVFAPLIAPQNPYDLSVLDIMDSRQPPGSESSTGMVFLLGSDGAGRDIFSAILYGMRTSLLVGISSGLLGMGMGVTIGLVAAYKGGRVETVIMRIVDLQLSFPTILIALILLSVVGKGVDKIILALVIAQWAYFARAVRAAALAEQRKEYVEAARVLRLSHARILFSHILPNCMPSLIVIGTLQTASAISLEATLSFLGVGLPPTEPSLGLLISNGFESMMSGRYWMSLFPGIALLIIIMAINLVGDQVRTVLNPKGRG